MLIWLLRYETALKKSGQWETKMPDKPKTHDVRINVEIGQKVLLEVFQDLFLRGPTEQRPDLRQALVSRAVGPWQHSEMKEKELLTRVGDNADVLTFERDASEGLDAATIVLWSRPDGYEATNIVPLKVGELDYRAYNAILQDFQQRIAAPAARQVGFQVETTSPRQSIEEWVSPKVVQALRRFSAAANKATGSSHPFDQKRWFEFLIEAHADDRQLDTERLARWLVEAEGWSDEKAHDLVIEYEFGLALLSEYDRRRS
jgi:hypothetical protein